MLKEFQSNWKRLPCTQEDKTYLLAVSGGMDSMALATLMHQSRIRFAVAHCNFSLRGKESDLDEALVAAWCTQHDVLFQSIRFDTESESKARKKGIQETARDLRYAWFRMLAVQYKYHRIVTAHHADDNAETLLINLFRGTGISGLHGIRVDHDGILRPLLFATRQEIVEFVKEQNIQYREDASNASDTYLRNAVRHKVMPAVNDVFPQGVHRINDSISRFADAGYFYNKALTAEKKRFMEQRGKDYYLPVRKLANHPAVGTLLYELLQPFGIGTDQLAQVLSLMQSESGHYMVTPTHRIIRNREFLVVTALQTKEADLILVEQLPAKVVVGTGTLTFSEHKDRNAIPTDKTTACVDMKLMEFPIVIRKLKTGDYFYPFGMKMKKKKISRYLIDQKVALHEKENVWVVESAKRIIWVVGMRMDERFRISESSEEVMKICL